MQETNKELKEKIQELELKIEELQQQYYFDMRNKQIEIQVLKNKLRGS